MTVRGLAQFARSLLLRQAADVLDLRFRPHAGLHGHPGVLQTLGDPLLALFEILDHRLIDPRAEDDHQHAEIKQVKKKRPQV